MFKKNGMLPDVAIPTKENTMKYTMTFAAMIAALFGTQAFADDEPSEGMMEVVGDAEVVADAEEASSEKPEEAATEEVATADEDIAEADMLPDLE